MRSFWVEMLVVSFDSIEHSPQQSDEPDVPP